MELKMIVLVVDDLFLGDLLSFCVVSVCIVCELVYDSSIILYGIFFLLYPIQYLDHVVKNVSIHLDIV